jgi:hypothetical protein
VNATPADEQGSDELRADDVHYDNGLFDHVQEVCSDAGNALVWAAADGGKRIKAFRWGAQLVRGCMFWPCLLLPPRAYNFVTCNQATAGTVPYLPWCGQQQMAASASSLQVGGAAEFVVGGRREAWNRGVPRF